MKKLLLILIILLALSLPICSAVSIENAIDIGANFIKQNVKVGSQGILVSDYTVNIAKAYQNDIDYRLIYLVSSDSINKNRYIMIEISKSDGKIKKVYMSKDKYENNLSL